MNNFSFQRLWRFFALSLLVFLTACATSNTFTVQQEVFQQLGGVAPKGTYAFRKADTQDLERSAYANLLQQHMPRTGLYQATSEKTADYIVDFFYKKERRQQLVQETYNDPFFFYPYMGFGYWSGSRYYGGMNMMFHPSLFYNSSSTVTEVSYNYYTLRVLLSRRADNQTVYQSTVAASSQAPLVRVMPYLMAAVFDGYPGQSTQVREVVFDLDQPGAGLGIPGSINTQGAKRVDQEESLLKNSDLP
jgi:hypothetical protein